MDLYSAGGTDDRFNGVGLPDLGFGKTAASFEKRCGT